MSPGKSMEMEKMWMEEKIPNKKMHKKVPKKKTLEQKRGRSNGTNPLFRVMGSVNAITEWEVVYIEENMEYCENYRLDQSCNPNTDSFCATHCSL